MGSRHTQEAQEYANKDRTDDWLYNAACNQHIAETKTHCITKSVVDQK